MASTRSTTGNSKPRIHLSVSTAPERKRKTTTTTTKRSSGVTKRKAPATHHKRKPHLADKIEGAAEKAVGKVTRRPGKKAAGTKKMHGTDGKGSRGRKARV
ncbi:hypothetical protein GGR57DRAFT_478623 [Xylariaceae sp. FL1272]|nr:hypothetical protein GGR57DRAFT_478623 [Xylariaceae sp. FL1272]